MSDEKYEEQYVKEAFDTNWIAPLGNNVNLFEKELAEYVNVEAGAALSSGTSAIHLALKLLNIKENDFVMCSTFTFVASANPILYEKAQPIFIDSDLNTWNMSPIALEKALAYCEKIGEMPKAVIIVHLYGMNAEIDTLISICSKYNIPVIEDSAESLGSLYKGKMSGTFGDFGIYSFNGNKIITTSGGGMLISNHQNLIQKAKFLATQSKENFSHYEHKEIGYNYRLSNISAGIGRGQLKILNQRIEKKRAIFDKYFAELGGIEGIEFLIENENQFCNRWLTVLTIDSNKTNITNKEIMANLEKNNIEARLLWKPMHLQPLFKNNLFFSHVDKTSVSEKLFNDGLCLPSDTNMSSEEQDSVIDVIKNSLMNNEKNLSGVSTLT